MKRLLVACLLLAFGFGLLSLWLASGGRRGRGGGATLHFTDVAGASGLNRISAAGNADKLWILETVGTGCALFDADGDGLLDIFLGNSGWVTDGKIHLGSGSTYYRQLPDGTFEDQTDKAGLSFRGWMTGVAVGDFDNDGDPDLFVACYGQDLLWRNRGDGSFEEITSQVGLTVERAGTDFSTSAVFFDYDGDGFLDLYVARYVEFDLLNLPHEGKPCLKGGVEVSCAPNFYEPQADRLYRNVAGTHFLNVSSEAGVDRKEGAYGLGVVTGDFDGDRRPDLYVANDTTANLLWHNLNGERFEDVALFAGVALSDEGRGQAGMGVDVGDADGDLDLDLIVTNYSEEINAFYRNLGDGTFESAARAAGLANGSYLMLGWGVKLEDLDNDGDLDLAVANGHVYPQATAVNPALSYAERCLFYTNDGGGQFREVGQELGEAARTPRTHRALAAGDVDNDGDIDLLLSVEHGRPALLRNDGQVENWISLRLEGTRCNRDGVGAVALLEAGGKTQRRDVTRGGSYLSAQDVRMHFGLGGARVADQVVIRWPSGAVDTVGPLPGRTFYRIEEGSGKAMRARS